MKVDKGLEAEKDGVSLMKPMPTLDALLTRAVKLGVFGTKMRSVINLASKDGIAAVVAQQFDVAAQIAGHGLMPIIEPEVSIKSPDKAGAEAILLAELTKHLDAVPDGRQVMLKLTLPDVAGSLFSADERQTRGAGGRTVRRLYAGRGLQAPRRQSRHDRELFASPGGRPQAFDERCGVRGGAGKIHRRDLPSFDRQGVTAGKAHPLQAGRRLK